MPARAFHSLFENWFDRGLEPDSAFADARADAAYRSSQPVPVYPAEVWKAALEWTVEGPPTDSVVSCRWWR